MLQDWNIKENRLNKIGALQVARNKHGEFKVATHYQEEKWSRHIDVIEITEKEEWWRLEQANNRTSFLNEIILDFDPILGEDTQHFKNRVGKVFFSMKEKEINFRCFFSGSRGYHFHIEFNYLVFLSNHHRDSVKKAIISLFNAELLKASERTMIALEYTPHWKTGNAKKEVFEDEFS